jgi:hypothetical protein
MVDGLLLSISVFTNLTSLKLKGTNVSRKRKGRKGEGGRGQKGGRRGRR